MNERIDVIKDAALKAGEEVLKYDSNIVTTEIKSTAGDLVTAADLGSERVITAIIKANFPDDIIISEETSEGQELLDESHLPSLRAWVLDPIDGTNNFKKGMAYSGISIGYIDKGVIVLGAVYDPYKRELYLAAKGQGATRNGEPIHVAEKSTFDAGTRVCTSNSYEGGTQANLARYEKLGHVWVDVLGSAVLIMTDVASGRLDLYHHNGLKPWDNAAAFLIAEEAGAKITNLLGRPTNWLTSEVVVGNPSLVDEFIARTKN
ncbi:MAG: inositol monophosphatase [bacterium]|nr:inositol monophosphatase [bacterium]